MSVSRPAALLRTQRTRDTGAAMTISMTARCLLGRPAGDERRRGQADEDDAELDEQQLQEAADAAEIGARCDRVQQLGEVGRAGELFDEGLCGARERQAEEADAGPPCQRGGEVVADGTRQRPAQSDQRVGQPTAWARCW